MNKTTLLLSSIFFFSFLNLFSQNEEYQIKPRPIEFESIGKLGDSVLSIKMPIATNSLRVTTSNKLPYPIIFIHGLNSSSETWNTTSNYLDSQYSFTFGGRFDFCLNADNDNTIANTNFYPVSGADIAAFETTIMQNGDYYYVNFNVNPDGTIGTDALSNQCAITKQGVALKKAIERVLELTGKNKVILVGHSMGGLASREYIQNSSNWQADNAHHVAKLLTVGTPNGGSNSSDSGIGVFVGIDTHSEAIRDLKTTYYYSSDPGRYLFGGIEINNSSNMNEHLFGSDFFNIDVNCNGTIGDNIIGLNQKSIDNLIDFSSIIGRLNGNPTDGVVTEESATMDNFITGLTYPTKYFYYTSSGLEVHTALPSQYSLLIQGLDEPNFKELAYEIDTNVNYTGFTTVQEDTNSLIDNDYFKFNVAENVLSTVEVSNISTSQMEASILDESGILIGTIENNNGSSLIVNNVLSSGTYYLKLSSLSPTNSDYQTPYNFSITTTLSTNSFEDTGIVFYPNPVKDILNIENIHFTKMSLYTTLGQLLEIRVNTNASTKNKIDLSNYAKGIYFISLENDNETKTIKIIKE